MKRALAALLLVFAWLCAPMGAARAQSASAQQPRILVELFTAQGCSSCPYANRVIGELADDPDVLALTFPVEYWDYLGWADTLADPYFARRQRLYGAALGVRGLPTPQFIFNGARQIRGYRSTDIRAALDSVRSEARAPALRVSLSREGDDRMRIAIGAGSAPVAPADIWLASYNPGPVVVSVRSGENAGRLISHYNVVRNLLRIGQWNGQAQSIERRVCRPACAVIVQAPDGGPAIGFAALPPR